MHQDCFDFSIKKKRKFRQKKEVESARGRTWNLLLRRQTRYPLRHKPGINGVN